jgi:signal recognition particle subunit SRP54
MFENLTDKLQRAFKNLRGQGTLSEENISEALREIRVALLEADVNLNVVRELIEHIREKAVGTEVLTALSPSEQVIKIVRDELISILGKDTARFKFAPQPPTVILMAGLQGSGKTTAAAKLARWLREERAASVAVAACDVYRPAAVEQLVKLAAQAGVDAYERGTDRDPVEIAAWALERAREEGKDVLIVDTSGRLHVDRELMDELVRIRDAVKPHDVLLVVDAMTGQDAVNVAEQFAEAVKFDGVVLSKLDGDARGGAALSVKAVTGRPILFASTGEKLDRFEPFHPDRMAQRILGMGDVMTLIEHAERQFDEGEAAELERKLRRNEFDLDDFLSQLRTIRKMGPLTNMLGMIPGLAGHQLQNMKVDERELDRIQAIILSMTPDERRAPELIKGSRRLRIARGSGTNVQAVSRLIKQFGQTRKIMRQVGRGKLPDVGALMRGAR